MSEIVWLTAFIDLPAESFDEASRFWEQALNSPRSAARGDRDHFATFLPAAGGDTYVRLQRLDEEDAEARIHLDLHTTSVPEIIDRATSLGAHRLGGPESGYDVEVLSSPAGLVFCVVPHDGEDTVPPPNGLDTPHRFDQICIDVPSEQFDAECDFWAALTGWDRLPALSDEFAGLDYPPSIPLRPLFQRLGLDDGATTARAHIDISSGTHTNTLTADHQRLGATHVAEGHRWTVLRDPAGLPYCLTQRQPT